MVSPKGGTNGARIDDAARPPHESLDEAITEYLMACDVESKSPRTISRPTKKRFASFGVS